MFTSQAMIAVFFKLLNFFILMSLAAYAFKKYILPVVQDLMAKKEAEKEFLLSQQTFCDQRQYELDDTLRKDALLGEDLKIKINQWKRVVDNEHACENNDDVARRSRTMRKNDKKRALKEAQRVQEKVLRSVIMQLSQVLPRDFENEKAGDTYLSDLVAGMDKRAS